jgi:5-methyltetrahydropteroyltriglutamate--homocysteine methyltransferase
MLNHFWQKIPSFQGETRPKPITQYDPNVFHPAAICRGPISDAVDLGLVEVFQTASSFARPDPFTSFDPVGFAIFATLHTMGDCGTYISHNCR